MSATNGTINSIKGTSTLVRARFGPGMLLQHEDLEQLNAYTRELSRLLFRSFFGCGVVCGLEVRTRTHCGKVIVTVSSGLALGCSGDPVHLPKVQSLTFDEDRVPTSARSVWVLLCGNTRSCAPRTPACASDDEEAPSVSTRERDGFEICIVSVLPPCICGCAEERYDYEDRETGCGCVGPNHPCYRGHYAGKCGCHGGEECDCACDCILLAQLDKPDEEGDPWPVDHRVRRFVRPVLMRDPLAVNPHEEKADTSPPAPAPIPPAPTPPPAPPPEPEPEPKPEARGQRAKSSKIPRSKLPR